MLFQLVVDGGVHMMPHVMCLAPAGYPLEVHEDHFDKCNNKKFS
jgi:hypothetical protein